MVYVTFAEIGLGTVGMTVGMTVAVLAPVDVQSDIGRVTCDKNKCELHTNYSSCNLLPR